MSAERVIQAAVITALKADAPYMALIPGGVHDASAPKGTAFAYSVLGATTETPDHVMEADGWEVTLTIHDWSSYEGKKECQDIREARNTVLHSQILTVAGFGLTTLRYEFGEISTDYDPDIQQDLMHGVSRYRVSALEA